MTSDPNPSPNPPTGAPNPAVLPLAIALLVAAGGGGFVAYRLWAGHAATLTPIQYPGAVRSKPAAGESDESAPPAAKRIPDRLPDVSMPDAKGVSHKLSDWKGRPLMVNFWATWCDPCRREIPLLKSLRHERAAESLEVVGIAVDFQDAVMDYTRKIGIDYPVLIGEKDGMAAIDAFGMETVFPFTVFADKEGRIFTVKVGELHSDEAKVILDGLRDVDEGKVDLAAARQRIAGEMAKLEAEHSRQSAATAPGKPPRS
jgi:thiol-disulfide isomerase/thioredoxin